jgi:hypothetical protein
MLTMQLAWLFVLNSLLVLMQIRVEIPLVVEFIMLEQQLVMPIYIVLMPDQLELELVVLYVKVIAV